jgi:hypothetical protein
VRGIWRRTSLAEYRKKSPNWETVIDLDALGKLEGENWVWHGASCLEPEYRHCLVNLSRGGADAQVVREFDLEHKAFVAEGFRLEEAKNDASWIDADTLYVSTDFGPGTMTTSGYPRIVKEWKRGTPLAEAKTVFEAETGDVGTGAARDHTKGFVRDFVVRIPTFFTNQQYLRRPDGTLARIEVPDDAEASVQREWLMIKPRTPWTVADKTYAAGALLATRFDDWMAGKRELTVLFEPTATTSLSEYEWTRHHVLLNVLDDVKNRVYVLTPGPGAVEARAPARRTEVRHDLGRRRGLGRVRRLLHDRHRLPHADHAAPRRDRQGARRSSRRPRRSSTPRAWPSRSTSRNPRTARASPTSRSRARRSCWTARTRPCCTATAASRFRSRPPIRARSGAPGSRAAACSWSRTSAAAASTARAGTAPR